MRDHPLNDRLDEVRVPTLILWGRHDRLIDVSCVPVLEAGIAGAQAQIFDLVGHVPTIEDPKATAAAIKGSLRPEEHTSELQLLLRLSYAVFCLTNKHKKPII